MTGSLPFRSTVFAVLITAAAGQTAGRILNVMRLYEPVLYRPEGAVEDRRGNWAKTRPEPMPTHGDNDRSRWLTIRTLVDEGTYVIGRRVTDPATGQYQDTGPMTEDGWRTIDKVLHPETGEFYSSKPPLLPTLLAGEYWLLRQLFGWSITDEQGRWYVVRTILLTVNWLPFVIYLVLLSRLVDRYGVTDWGRMYVLTAAAFGTFITTFAITLNNHTIAAFCVLFALYPALHIWESRDAAAGWYALSGLFAGFAATNELPALSFTALLGFLLLLRAPGRTLLFFAPAAAVPLAALLLTNYLALGEFTPAYEKFGSSWYEYEGSYWKPDPLKPRTGIDWAWQNESRAVYALHVLIGHHGLFSLSPIYLLTVVGALASLFGSVPSDDRAATWTGLRRVALLALILTVVVVSFYIVGVDNRTRNYGGWTVGLRWLIWLTPLWLLTLLPTADWLAARRWGRAGGYVLLAVSVFSASHYLWNPWRQPWLYNLLESFGWPGY